jgi:hypothetical protein
MSPDQVVLQGAHCPLASTLRPPASPPAKQRPSRTAAGEQQPHSDRPAAARQHPTSATGTAPSPGISRHTPPACSSRGRKLQKGVAFSSARPRTASGWLAARLTARKPPRLLPATNAGSPTTCGRGAAQGRCRGEGRAGGVAGGGGGDAGRGPASEAGSLVASCACAARSPGPPARGRGPSGRCSCRWCCRAFSSSNRLSQHDFQAHSWVAPAALLLLSAKREPLE